jgi:hypothetical protein
MGAETPFSMPSSVASPTPSAGLNLRKYSPKSCLLFLLMAKCLLSRIRPCRESAHRGPIIFLRLRDVGGVGDYWTCCTPDKLLVSKRSSTLVASSQRCSQKLGAASQINGNAFNLLSRLQCSIYQLFLRACLARCFPFFTTSQNRRTNQPIATLLHVILISSKLSRFASYLKVLLRIRK